MKKNKLIFAFIRKFSTGLSAVPGASGSTQVSAAPVKTKEHLKVESLMQQWPEYLRNPPRGNIDLEIAKGILEELYKYHQGDKKYLGPYDVPLEISRKTTSGINFVKTTDSIADYFRTYEGFLPDHFIMGRFRYMAYVHGEKTSEFFDTILPQVKKLILNADRQTATNLFIAVEAGTYMNIADKEFWDMIEFKLVNERLYRYLTLSEAASVAYHLVIGRRANKVLLKQLEVHFIKHRKALSLDKKTRGLVEGAYSISGGSETLFAALEDPNIEVPGIDANIPRMDKVPGGDSKRSPTIEHHHDGNKQVSHH